MDKKETLDALDTLSQRLLENLAEVEAIKKQVNHLIEENADLRLENIKLRERLEKEEQGGQKNDNFAQENLKNIYEDGFHICTMYYGQRRDTKETCIFCSELLYR